MSADSLVSSLPTRPFPQTTAHGRSHCQAGPALPVSPSPPVLLPISPCAPNKTPSSEQLNCSAHTASPYQSARKTASGAGEKKNVKIREELLARSLSVSRSLGPRSWPCCMPNCRKATKSRVPAAGVGSPLANPPVNKLRTSFGWLVNRSGEDREGGGGVRSSMRPQPHPLPVLCSPFLALLLLLAACSSPANGRAAPSSPGAATPVARLVRAADAAASGANGTASVAPAPPPVGRLPVSGIRWSKRFWLFLRFRCFLFRFFWGKSPFSSLVKTCRVFPERLQWKLSFPLKMAKKSIGFIQSSFSFAICSMKFTGEMFFSWKFGILHFVQIRDRERTVAEN